MESNKKEFLNAISVFGTFVIISFPPAAYLTYIFFKDQDRVDLEKLIIFGTVHAIANLGFAFFYIKDKILLSKENSVLNLFLLLNIFFLLPVFPISIFTDIFQPSRLLNTYKILKMNYPQGYFNKIINLAIKKFAFVLFILIFIIPFWAVSYLGTSNYIKNEINFRRDSIKVVGTGSMYPTFPKGDGKNAQELSKEVVATPGMSRFPAGFSIFGRSFFKYNLHRGDIISFTNDAVKSIIKDDGLDGTGFIKRIIALPGDTLEIRDGLVRVNGIEIKEPYIARARSTFGGDSLKECQILQIPENKAFVMGDNRKSSQDSRFKLGLIDFSDVDHVIPFDKQKGILDKNWRDTSHDNDPSAKIHLDKNEYLELLNQKRADLELKPLKLSSKLDETAKLRGEIMFKKQDLEPNTSDGDESMRAVLESKDLSTILIGEGAVKGYYDAKELIDNQFEFSTTKKFLTNKDFNEIGIAEVSGLIENCPAQIIVTHISGYVPPTYSTDQINTITVSIANLKTTKESWIQAKGDTFFYNENKADFDKIFSILDYQIAIYEKILSKMQNVKWLDKDEQKFLSEDTKKLSEERDRLMTKLNNKIQELSKPKNAVQPITSGT